MADRAEQAAATRRAWLATIERHRHDRDTPGSPEYWSPRLDTASRDENYAPSRTTKSQPWRRSSTRTAISIGAGSSGSASFLPTCERSTT